MNSNKPPTQKTKPLHFLVSSSLIKIKRRSQTIALTLVGFTD